MDKVVDMAVDERFMREALREAMAAEAEDEIPIGAVIVLIVASFLKDAGEVMKK